MHKCIICGEPLGKASELMFCRQMPASAQDIPAFDELSTDQAVDLRLCQCLGCGLVQFDCEPVSYYRDVIRAGGYSSTMAALRRSQYRHFIDMCGLEGKKIIEIGCGQGEFLQILTEFPVKAYGIEHRAELADKARSVGLNVWQDFTESADSVLNGAPYDAFLSFNFLEHQPDPNAMLRCIYNNLTDDGVGLVTVPSWEYILANHSFYELLRDHIANYSEQTLRFLMNRNGFDVLESTTVNRDTLSVIVKKRPLFQVDGLKEGFASLARQMSAFFNQRTDAGKHVAVWGASHQSFTAIAASGTGEKIAYIIDSAPFKQGRYAPASHVPIVAPTHFFEEPVDSILIIAPGYTDEIAGIIREKFGGEVEIAAILTASVVLL